jgi:hypothetical protein
VSTPASAGRLASTSDGARRGLATLGLTPDDVRAAGKEAAPRLLLAAEAAALGLPDKATAQLLAAGPSALPLVTKAAGRLAQKLPDGAGKSLLSNQAFLTAVVRDPSLHAATAGLVRPQTRLAAARSLLAHDVARDATLRAIGSDPAVTSALERVGLAPADLAEAGRAAVPLWDAADAFKAGKVREGLASLSRGVEAAPEVSTRLAQKAQRGLVGKLPEGPAKSVLSSPDVLAAVVSDPALHGAVGELFAGATRSEGLRALISHDASREAVLGALSRDASVQASLSKLGLTPAELPQLGRAAPAAWNVSEAVQRGDFEAAARGLVELKGSAPALAARVGRGLAQVMPPAMQKGLGRLGLTGDNLVEAGVALPSLLSAAKLAGAGDGKGALAALGGAALAAPDTMTKAITELARTLPGDGLVKSMLTDPVIVRQMASNQAFHGSLRGLLKGDASALRALSANAALGGPVAERLWAKEGLRARLSKLGFESAQDVAQGFGGLAAAMSVGDFARANDPRAAIEGLGAVAASLPDGLRRRVTARLTQTMKLPPGLSNVLIEGGLALTDPAVRRSLADAAAKVRGGDVQGFLKALSSAGGLLAKDHPAAAAGFLDSLQHLPGSMGRLFKDAELNRLLVSTGTAGQLFGAAAHLANGDPAAAVGDVGQAVAGLVGAGPRFVVNGQELPVLGQDGAKAMGKLFERVVDALPPQAKAKVLQKVADISAKAGKNVVPVIGPALGIIGEAQELHAGLQRKPPDYLSTAVDGSQLVLHVASLFPAAQPFAQPINVGLGFIEAAADARLLIEDLQAFKREFTGLAGGAS